MQPCYCLSTLIWVPEYRKEKEMIKKKDYILKRIQKIFLIFRVWGKKCYQKEQKAFTLIEMKEIKTRN